MLFNDLFENDREPYSKAIDKLEVAHINNLNAKMDEIIQRVNREKLSPEHKQALKQEYIRLKAERDSIYGIKDGTPEFTVECDEEGNASVIDRIGQAIAQFTAKKYGSTAFDAATAYAGSTFKSASVDDIAGWENAAAKKRGPVRLKPVVKKQPDVIVAEWRNSAPGASDEEQKKLKKVGIVRRKAEQSKEQELDEEYTPVTRPVPQPKKLNPGWALDPTTKAELKRRKDVRNRKGVDEGWSDAIVAQRTGRPRTPYSVYIKGKKWKDFENDDHAEAVANKLRAKFKAEGRDPSVITIAPTDYDKDIKEASSPAQQAAIAIAKKKEQGVDEGTKQRLDPKCWTGYKKQGTKIKGGVRVNNCVPVEESTELVEEFDLIETTINYLAERNQVDPEVIWEDLESLSDDELYVFATTQTINEDWQKANRKDKTSGMSKKAVKAYRREHPGSKLQTAVTTKPSKLKKGSKASKRRKSYCSRSRGQMKMHNISCQKTPDKAICKARRRWNCEESVQEGYHANTIGAIAKAAPVFKIGDAMWTRDQNGKPVSGEVVELRPGSVVFRTEDGRKFRAPEGRVMKRMHEGSMADAEHHSSGAKFGGYWKGTDKNPPKPGQGFGGMEESEEKENPMGEKELAYLIAKAKGMKSPPVDSHLHHGDEHEIYTDKDYVGETKNFMEWAMSQSTRFPNFATNPEVYAKAKNAFFEDIYGGIPKIAKVPTGAMYSNAKLPTLKTNLRKAKEKQIRTAKTLNKSLAEDEQLDEDLVSFFNQAQNLYDIYQFLKTNGLPVALFVASVLTYGLHNTLKQAKQDETKFMKMAKSAWKKVDHGKVEKLVAWLNTKFTDVMHTMDFNDPNGYVSDLTEVSEAESELQPGQYYIWTVHFDDGTESRVKVTSDQFDPKAYYAKKNKVVIKTDYDWTIHG